MVTQQPKSSPSGQSQLPSDGPPRQVAADCLNWRVSPKSGMRIRTTTTAVRPTKSTIQCPRTWPLISQGPLANPPDAASPSRVLRWTAATGHSSCGNRTGLHRTWDLATPLHRRRFTRSAISSPMLIPSAVIFVRARSTHFSSRRWPAAVLVTSSVTKMLARLLISRFP